MLLAARWPVKRELGTEPMRPGNACGLRNVRFGLIEPDGASIVEMELRAWQRDIEPVPQGAAGTMAPGVRRAVDHWPRLDLILDCRYRRMFMRGRVQKTTA